MSALKEEFGTIISDRSNLDRIDAVAFPAEALLDKETGGSLMDVLEHVAKQYYPIYCILPKGADRGALFGPIESLTASYIVDVTRQEFYEAAECQKFLLFDGNPDPDKIHRVRAHVDLNDEKVKTFLRDGPYKTSSQKDAAGKITDKEDDKGAAIANEKVGGFISYSNYTRGGKSVDPSAAAQSNAEQFGYMPIR